MSTFKVEILPVEKLVEHTNAERLEIAFLEGLGFPIVVQKDLYSVGSLAVYFPLDSVLPAELTEKLGLKNSRIRTVRLRGEISQGFCVPTQDLFGPENDMFKVGDDLTEYFGVTKYEPPIVNCGTANLTTLPQGISVYDIEGCERYKDIVEYLLDKEVVVTEKLEGSNFGLDYAPLAIFSRRHTITPIEGFEHTFHRAARVTGLVDFITSLTGKYTLRGEIIGPGIQSNIYGLKDHTIKIFDVMVGNKYESFDGPITRELIALGHYVPILFRGKLRDYLNGWSIRDISNGQSVLAPRLREGIVIKPVVEEELERFGRLIIKQRSPEYLAKEK